MRESGIDQRIQQLREKSQLGQPKATCSSGNKATYICINPSCTNPSLHCEGCKDCEHHIKNSCQSVRLKIVTLLFENLSQTKKKLVKVILQQEQKMIQKIQQGNQKLLQKIGSSCVQDKYKQIMQQIYKGNKEVKLTGKEAAVIFENLQSDKKVVQKQLSVEIAIFSSQLHRVTQQVFRLQNKLLNLTQKYQIRAQIKGNINSAIIGSYTNDCQFIYKCLRENANGRQVHKIELVYRASHHDFALFSFKKINFKQSNVLILVKTEFGKVIGGFVPKQKNPFAKQDNTDHSFLFSVTLRQKMKPIVNTVFNYTQSGFAFKGPQAPYADLFIGDKCNLSNYRKNTYALFPVSYNHNHKYVSCQQTFALFSGAQQGAYFKVLEYEVFTVVFK